MTESNDVSDNNVWDFIQKNPRILGFNITNDRVLDLLGAMFQIHLELEQCNYREANIMLTSVATALVAGITGSGDEVVEEIMVAEAMEDFDESLKEVLNEGQ